MMEPILNGRKILAVDDESDILKVLEEEIADACPDCAFDTAASFEAASDLLHTRSYDIVILDIMGVRGFDLLDMAVSKKLKVVMLTTHALNPGALKKSYEMKARAYLPKDQLGDIVPFLEDVLTSDFQSGWARLFEKLHSFFTGRFESDWEKKTGLTWRKWVK